MPRHSARALLAALLLAWGTLAMSCSAEVAPEFLTLSITSDAPKSGELDTLRFLFTDGQTTWPSDPASAEGNKELSSSSDPVAGTVIVQIDYQTLTAFSSDTVTLQVSGLSEGVIRTSFEGAVTLTAKEVIEVRLRQLEDNCDADGDGFLDCTIADCCSTEDMALSDCEPDDPNANPFGTEVECEPCSDTVDNDCQGGDQPCIDSDDDGVPDCEETAEASGCPPGAENDPDIYPSRPELCDSKDNDCNGETDETFLLTTVKGTPGVGEPCGGGECADGTVECVDPTRVECSEVGAAIDDCGESQAGNGKDEDCDGLTDEGCDESDLDGDGYSEDDCDPEDAAVYPGAAEGCCLLDLADGEAIGQTCATDTAANQPCPAPLKCVSVGETEQCVISRCDSNCDGAATVCSTEDADGDGHVPPNDCDDTDPMIYPSAPERCGDGIDQSCSGVDLSCDGVVDGDGDGWSPPIDCLDDDDDVNPSEVELCDGQDNDCDDVIDEDNPETNNTAPCGTGEGECILGQTICVNGGGITGEVACIGDKGPETDICNGLDDDCDGQTDEDFSLGGVASLSDLDGTPGLTLGDSCGSGACQGGTVVCGPGSSTLLCPTHAEASPDVCNGLDDDCDGQTDEDFVAGGTVSIANTDGSGALVKGDSCGTGACANGSVLCTPDGKGIFCDTAASASPDVCNGDDDDCDGTTDEDFISGGTLSYTTTDGVAGRVKGDACGTGTCGIGQVVCATNGLTLVCDNTAPGPDLCDDLDNDCDGTTDEAFIAGGVETYTDLDGSAGKVKGDSCGTGQCTGSGLVVCTKGGEALTCNVLDQVSPDVCDGADNDCDGATDEDFIDGGTVTYTDLDGTTGKIKGTGCGVGDCSGGSVVCHGAGDVLTCDTAPQAGLEVCDGADNDCDGKIDETFMDGTVTYTDGDGTTGKVKGDPCGTGACGTATVICDPNNSDMLACGTTGAPTPDVCDDVDNDCDGVTDEAFIADGSVTYTDGDGTTGKVKGESCGTGACATGTVVCHAGGDALTCDTAKNATPDVCDDADNDCDGAVDEAFIADGTVTYTDGDGTAGMVKGESCGTGACAAGTVICHAGGDALTCDTATSATPDVCDDADNDCDGATDEAFVADGSVTFVDSDGTQDLVKGDDCGTGTCGDGQVVCGADGDALACSNTLGSVERCDGLDNDCDGDTDEDFASEGTITVADVNGSGGLSLGDPCGGVGSCASAVVVCSADGSTMGCASATSASADLCDGDDNDCDGATDEDFSPLSITDLDGTAGLQLGDACGTGACDALGAGLVQCSADGSGIECSTDGNASADICDGVDNDCDGIVDEAFIEGGTVTATDVDGSGSLAKGASCGGIGSCGAGTVVCNGTSALICSTTASASADLCDGTDNDCDGAVDEDFTADGTVTATDVDGSGSLAKGQACGGIGSCGAGTVVCDGASALVCSTTASASADLCDGTDNDCDGAVDEDFIAGGTVTATDVDGSGSLTKGASCGGIGSCGAGTVVCNGTSALVCSTTASASADLCDGDDNDCDGAVDEDFTVGGTVTATDVDGSGALSKGKSCGGIGGCGAGTVVCDGASALVCSTTASASADICDGTDNDCDGAVDEDFIDGGTVTATDVDGTGSLTKGASCGGAGACPVGTVICDGPSALVCSTTASATADICDGDDNDCDGVVDEHFIDGGEVTFTNFDGTTGLAKDASCGGGTCGSGDVICSAGGATLTCSAAGTPGAESCDNQDNDCDGDTDEDFSAGGSVTIPNVNGKGSLALGQACGSVGECAAGTVQCNGTGGLACSTISSIGSELCDDADNDCDGNTDEDFSAGGSVTIPNVDGTGSLALGQACGSIGECGAGSVQCNGTGGLSCSTASSSSPDVCDAADNDCDGNTDEDFSAGGSVKATDVDGSGSLHLAQACGGIGICGGGTVICQGTGGLVCSTTSAVESETCDNQDDDCDGDTDEGMDLNGNDIGALAAADCKIVGVCAADPAEATCDTGTYTCDYTGVASYEATETTCDGLDNDCDGVIDDLDPATDSICETTGECADFTAVCNGTSWECTYNDVDYEAGDTETGDHVCDGKDNDCDGVTDESCLTDGQVCTGANECNSNNCAPDGVCCAAACAGVCVECSTGDCASINIGLDPANECFAAAWINELHYDNTGSDANEGFEIGGPVGLDLTGWTVHIYEGDNGLDTASVSLSGTLTEVEAGIGAIWFDQTLENEVEGLALVDAEGVLVEFISYEGSFDGVDGPALGVTSTDIGVSEDGTAPSNKSLQLGGGATGSKSADFTWDTSANSSHDDVNASQTFEAPRDFTCSGAGACIDACTDSVKNQDETDIDCGGICGATCAAGESCVDVDDCDQSALTDCTDNICTEI